MKLAKEYNTLLKQRLHHYAAWSPITDRYEVGDFGAFRGGVFQKLGNIREFGVDPKPRIGASTVKFSLTSSGAVMVRTQAGAQVDVFPAQPVEAQLSIQFSGQRCTYIRTNALEVTEMPNVDAAAYQLRGHKDPHGRRWKLGWRIVRKVYVADNPVILASAERNVSFSLTGQADALKQLEVGNASAAIDVSSSASDALRIVGGRGPVALDLFKVRVTGRAALDAFDQQGGGGGGGERESEITAREQSEPEFDYDWQDEPDDDPEELFA
ncbi:MAG: hypothetical protein AAGF11_12655 [Myxococcota bacterium]